MLPAIVIEKVSPRVKGGHPAKRVQGETCAVEADIFRDGPDVLRACVRWWPKAGGERREAPLQALPNDAWRGSFPLEQIGITCFTIEAWSDPFSSWAGGLARWVEAGQDVAGELREGRRWIEAALQRPEATATERRELQGVLDTLREDDSSGQQALQAIQRQTLLEVMARLGPREAVQRLDPPLEIVVDRPLASFGAWYEMFPRSQGTVPGQAATLLEAEARLPAIRDLGFDVVYLPPVHPIGSTNRKGKNNAPVAEADDPGSPWAIGSGHGGHMAVEPALGTLADFEHFVAAARKLGMEVALDFAIQASPDHPWVKEHPDWFIHRADGAIRYAENPPKRYQDVYPFNFRPPYNKAQWVAWLDVLRFWIDRGVKIFRVDNPHTKPFSFWQWLIGQVKERNPEVIFLGEAFTRPKIMKTLAKLGFSQSYTYFTWRTSKAELAEYLTELTQTDMREYFRPNFFTNTPDILHDFLQQGGRPAFAIRLVLAATLSPAYGIYSGFELCENQAVPGTEEYLHSEKYEIKVRNWNQPGNLNELIAQVNRIRRENPALQQLTNLAFLPSDNDQILFYRKTSADGSNVLLVAVNLDPHQTQVGWVTVPLHQLGLPSGASYTVRDLLTDARYTWSGRNYVRLTPGELPAHILKVERPG